MAHSAPRVRLPGMPESRRVTAGFAVCAFAAVACGRSEPTRPTDPRIAASAGNSQTAYVDDTLLFPLVVTVDDGRRHGMPNVPIEWRVTAGSAELVSRSGFLASATTNGSGHAGIGVRPTALGTITITATTPLVPGATATFTAFATRGTDVVIRIGPGFDCGDPSSFAGPDGSSDVTVPVGAVVEWDYIIEGPGNWPCQAHVQSLARPVGALGFDALLGRGERFQFVPTVAGTWEFTDANNGGRGTLTAR